MQAGWGSPYKKLAKKIAHKFLIASFKPKKMIIN